MNTKDTLTVVIHTLNQITVCGAGNLDKLLGCIQVLERMKNELAAKAESEAKTSADVQAND